MSDEHPGWIRLHGGWCYLGTTQPEPPADAPVGAPAAGATREGPARAARVPAGLLVPGLLAALAWQVGAILLALYVATRSSAAAVVAGLILPVFALGTCAVVCELAKGWRRP
jgi:hypothetical protein